MNSTEALPLVPKAFWLSPGDLHWKHLLILWDKCYLCRSHDFGQIFLEFDLFLLTFGKELLDQK